MKGVPGAPLPDLSRPHIGQRVLQSLVQNLQLSWLRGGAQIRGSVGSVTSPTRRTPTQDVDFHVLIKLPAEKPGEPPPSPSSTPPCLGPQPWDPPSLLLSTPDPTAPHCGTPGCVSFLTLKLCHLGLFFFRDFRVTWVREEGQNMDSCPWALDATLGPGIRGA